MAEPKTLNPSPIAEGRTSAPAILRGLRAAGKTAVLTINGQPGWTVSDPASYEALIALAERAQEDEAIHESIEQMRRGEGFPGEQVLDEMRAIIDEVAPKRKARP